MTYADFITLMMIFFIVLYTFTPGVEKNKFEAIIGAFKGKQGLLQYNSVFSDPDFNVKRERAKSWQKFQQYIEDENLTGEVQVDLMPDGIRITLGEAVAFDTYSAELKMMAREILKKIGNNIKKYTVEDLEEIEIQGHTDNRPVKQNAIRYKSNWELGAARATSVLKYLAAKTSIQPQYLKASTYGPYRPKVDNDSANNRKQNRRVEMYIRYKETKEVIQPELAEKKSSNKKIGKIENGKARTTR